MTRHPTAPRHRAMLGRAALALALAFSAGAPAAAEDLSALRGAPVKSERVEVSYRDVNHLTELGRIPLGATEGTAWIDTLSRYIASRGERVLPAGQRLVVTINDVQRAGGFEPGRRGRLGDVRIVRDAYGPRIDLSFRVLSPQGDLIKEGERRLRDIDFMNRLAHRGDPLGYEKNLVDAWMRADLAAPRG